VLIKVKFRVGTQVMCMVDGLLRGKLEMDLSGEVHTTIMMVGTQRARPVEVRIAVLVEVQMAVPVEVGM